MTNVGLVAVSHSAPLAAAARDLALDMGRDATIVAAGGVDGGFGTSAELISAAIEEADAGAGVVVLVDLGSAVMSTEMALEFIDPDLAERTTVVPAPLVEGLVVAAVAAGAGARREDVAREAMGALAAKQSDIPYDLDDAAGAGETAAGNAAGADPGPDTREWISRTYTVDDPAGLHARPAGALVAAVAPFDAEVRVSYAGTGRGPVVARSMTSLISLGVVGGGEIIVQATGPEAEAALDAVGQLAERGWLADGEAKPETTIPAHKRQTGSGLEIAVGPALVWHADPRPEVCKEPKNQAEAYAEAREAVRTYLSSLGDDPILTLQIGLLDDPVYTGRITSAIDAGKPTQIAIQRATTDTVADYLELPTEYLRERSEDVKALGDLLIQALQGRPLGGLAAAIADFGRDPVVVLDSLTPALASEIDPGSVIGILAATGSSTGHGALIASAKGIPVIAGKEIARDVKQGQEIALEPRSGMVYVDPTRAQLRELLRASKEQARLAKTAREHAHEPALYDGRQIYVRANVAVASDAELGAKNGADGSGLVRTEVLFADWKHLPTVEEQAEVFVQIAEALGKDQPITIRTWDVGADKPVPFFDAPAEDNPFLGVRGIRLMRRFPDALIDQFRAVIRVAQRANIKVMIPMVTNLSEVAWARKMFNAAVEAEGRPDELPEFGMMLETPAALLNVAAFDEVVDFFSVGTNDLIQYVAAADRGNSSLSRVADEVIPLVVDLIADTVRKLASPLGICGDLASSEEHVPQLVRAGVASLSVRPALVPQIKAAIRAIE
ncbi:dihydroxyacetone kinase phosphoryl donor subunit DhaM [Trueperella sp.]|uniref:dihydroxyacetone kinase phosphoryl donor subunit DhaM n=1 Tax=Trueperella sp. TaxID=2699835 RepID=UPI00261E9FFC|nr:dihydroxyacetone kinase phosphoryl donor subunit DhaM [Trueperella sp.]